MEVIIDSIFHTFFDSMTATHFFDFIFLENPVSYVLDNLSGNNFLSKTCFGNSLKYCKPPTVAHAWTISMILDDRNARHLWQFIN